MDPQTGPGPAIDAREQRVHHTLGWAGSILLALVFIPLGLMKLADLENVRALFQGWGYSTWFMFFIGIVEVTAGILVLVPRLAAYGGAVLTVEMIGATLTHVVNAEWLAMLLPILAGALAVYVTWVRVPEASGAEARRAAVDGT